MNEMLNELIGQYLMPAFGAALVAIFGWIGKKVVNFVKVKQIENLAKVAVQAVEQVYKELHGKEKLEKALLIASKLAISKGIDISSEELEYYIEAAVGEFNDVFNQEIEGSTIIEEDVVDDSTIIEEDIDE